MLPRSVNLIALPTSLSSTRRKSLGSAATRGRLDATLTERRSRFSHALRSDVAALGKFDRVAHKLEQHASKESWVRGHARQTGRDIDRKTQPLFPRIEIGCCRAR